MFFFWFLFSTNIPRLRRHLSVGTEHTEDGRRCGSFPVCPSLLATAHFGVFEAVPRPHNIRDGKTRGVRCSKRGRPRQRACGQKIARALSLSLSLSLSLDETGERLRWRRRTLRKDIVRLRGADEQNPSPSGTTTTIASLFIASVPAPTQTTDQRTGIEPWQRRVHKYASCAAAATHQRRRRSQVPMHRALGLL
jgi:hypothetical protein